jgi:hypothetical protein
MIEMDLFNIFYISTDEPEIAIHCDSDGTCMPVPNDQRRQERKRKEKGISN